MNNKKNILIVDDDANFCNLIEDVLREMGHHVSTAVNMDQALGAASEMPDLIILDLMLAHTLSWELLRWLKSSEKTKQIPVIICSTIKEKKDMIQASGLGAADFITKPFVMSDFMKRIEKCLSDGA